MIRGTAYRRHQYYRKRQWARRVVDTWSRLHRDFYGPDFVARLAATPHRCSCLACGNQRRYEGRTVQERRQLQEMQAQLGEVSK